MGLLMMEKGVEGQKTVEVTWVGSPYLAHTAYSDSKDTSQRFSSVLADFVEQGGFPII